MEIVQLILSGMQLLGVLVMRPARLAVPPWTIWFDDPLDKPNEACVSQVQLHFCLVVTIGTTPKGTLGGDNQQLERSTPTAGVPAGPGPYDVHQPPSQ